VGGKILASTVLGAEDEWTSLAVNRPETMKAPPEPFRWPAVKVIASALEHGDAREEAGKRRGVVNELLGSGPIGLRERYVTKRQ